MKKKAKTLSTTEEKLVLLRNLWRTTSEENRLLPLSSLWINQRAIVKEELEILSSGRLGYIN